VSIRRGGKRKDPSVSDSGALTPPPGLRLFQGTGEQAGYAVLVFPTSPRRSQLENEIEALTTAERSVVNLLLEGLSNEAIAAHRRTSVRTVANQIQSIYRKLCVNSRTELAARVGKATSK
jgi:DNA-binding NarL/FixJ family response regulator